MLSTYTGFIKPESHEQLDAYTQDFVREELLRKVAIAVLTIPVDGRSALKLIDIDLRGQKDACCAGNRN